MPRQDGRSIEEEEDECASYGGSIDQNKSKVHTQHNSLYNGRREESGKGNAERCDGNKGSCDSHKSEG